MSPERRSHDSCALEKYVSNTSINELIKRRIQFMLPIPRKKGPAIWPLDLNTRNYNRTGNWDQRLGATALYSIFRMGICVSNSGTEKLRTLVRMCLCFYVRKISWRRSLPWLLVMWVATVCEKSKKERERGRSWRPAFLVISFISCVVDTFRKEKRRPEPLIFHHSSVTCVIWKRGNLACSSGW